jgi:DNA-binding transcriptional ArsR family regulator
MSERHRPVRRVLVPSRRRERVEGSLRCRWWWLRPPDIWIETRKLERGYGYRDGGGTVCSPSSATATTSAKYPHVGLGPALAEHGTKSRTLLAPATVRVMVNNVFAALANPVRRQIVERLAVRPRTVGAATTGLKVSKPAISRHVRVLENAGLVTRTVNGRTHVLALDMSALDEGRDWLDRQHATWERFFDAVDDLLSTEESDATPTPTVREER